MMIDNHYINSLPTALHIKVDYDGVEAVISLLLSALESFREVRTLVQENEVDFIRSVKGGPSELFIETNSKLKQGIHLTTEALDIEIRQIQTFLTYLRGDVNPPYTPTSSQIIFASANLDGNVLGIASGPVQLYSSQFSYVSQGNQGLLDSLKSDENALSLRLSEIEDMRISRETMQTELDQLRERLADLDRVSGSNPFDWLGDGAEFLGSRIFGEYGRVSGDISQLEEAIANLDTELGSAHRDVENLENSINQTVERLKLVTPPADADIEFIKNMEYTTTEAWLRPYTLDNGQGTCTTHIIDKIAIPRELIRNAGDWNNQALAHPEFGIQIGNHPLVGSVLVMERAHPYASDVAGHVMYVERIENGEVYVTDNNNNAPISLSQIGVNPNDANISYLYIPWHTQG